MFYPLKTILYFRFIRKGEVGGYKNEMSSELIEKFDNWTNRKFSDTDLKLLYLGI